MPCVNVVSWLLTLLGSFKNEGGVPVFASVLMSTPHARQLIQSSVVSRQSKINTDSISCRYVTFKVHGKKDKNMNEFSLYEPRTAYFSRAANSVYRLL